MSFFDRQGIPEALVRKQAESGNGHGSQEERDEYNSSREEEEEEEDNEDNTSEYSDDDGFEDDVQTLRDYSFLSVSTDRTFEMHALVQLPSHSQPNRTAQSHSLREDQRGPTKPYPSSDPWFSWMDICRRF